VYEAGNRTPALLRDLVDHELGDRQVLIARELSKLHQELLRGSVAELAARVTEPLRGEVTLVLEGRPAAPTSEDDPVQQAARAVLDVMLDPSLKPRARAKALAALTGLDGRELYARLDRLRGS
jgi:16S rRNA (cytidine1402-2'-O)-methyltransferase